LGNIGATVHLPGTGTIPAAGLLFGEEPSRVIVSFSPEHRAEVERRCTEHGVPFTPIGEVGGKCLELRELCRVSVPVLAEAHRRCLEPIVGE
ncbi:MAG: hypothetical protein ACODAG_00420, partial [Myxococcota bacterium]